MLPIIIVTQLSPKQALINAAINVPVNSPLEVVTPEPSLGIPLAREIIISVNKPPLNTPSKTLVITNFETATTQAQNALLKTLEELPSHTNLILISKTIDSILPTIRSRCQIIYTQSIENPLSVSQEVSLLIVQLPKLSLSGRIMATQPFTKTAQDVKQCLEALLHELHRYLLQKPSSKHIHSNTQLVLSALKHVSQNAHATLTLEHVFLHWQ